MLACGRNRAHSAVLTSEAPPQSKAVFKIKAQITGDAVRLPTRLRPARIRNLSQVPPDLRRALNPSGLGARGNRGARAGRGLGPSFFARPGRKTGAEEKVAGLREHVWDRGALDVAWIMDFTHLRRGQDRVHLAAVRDAHSRPVPGWAMRWPNRSGRP